MRRRVAYALLAGGVTLVCTAFVLIGMPRHFGTEPIAIPIISSVMTGATAYGLWPRSAERRDGIGMIAIRDLGLDPEKVNVNGGGVVLGHPIGASGARIMATLLAEMERRDAKKGVASLCIGGGEATAVAQER